MSSRGTSAPISDSQAVEIANLLNTRNQLTVTYTAERVLKEAANYIIRLSAMGEVIASVQLKRVQWYQAEVLHLTVAEAFERKGHAKALLCEAERSARNEGVRILQCTIRAGNTSSRALFEGFGFVNTCTFFNQSSGNNVDVFQKVLETSC